MPSVDLFLQFRIEDPAEFIFSLGWVKRLPGQAAECDQRSDPRADLRSSAPRRSTTWSARAPMGCWTTLNQQFLPAVRFVNANITHAEPSSQEYRMDLAAPEMIRVAKEAYTYQYELQLRKEQNEGDLNKELAVCARRCPASAPTSPTYQARMDTARERETNRANADARQRLVEAESPARRRTPPCWRRRRSTSAPSAPPRRRRSWTTASSRTCSTSLEASPATCRSWCRSGEHRPEHRLRSPSPGRCSAATRSATLYTAADMEAIRERLDAIEARIAERMTRIEALDGRRNRSPSSRPARRTVVPREAISEARVEADQPLGER